MADTTIAFVGIRLEINEAEIESLEERSHPALVNAKKAGLQHYWGNFGSPGERYFLFLGRLVGKLGVEDSLEVQIDLEQFAHYVADVRDRLVTAGFSTAPSLFLHLQPD
jgi:hypothetical protein